MQTQYNLADDGSLHLTKNGYLVSALATTGRLGILYETNTDVPGKTTGDILKHGAAETVLQEYRRYWVKLQRAWLDNSRQDFLGAMGITPETYRAMIQETILNLKIITLPVAILSQPTIDEINVCLQTTGRAGLLRERLEIMHTVVDDEPTRH